MFHDQAHPETRGTAAALLSAPAQLVHGLVRDRFGLVCLRRLPPDLPVAAAASPLRHPRTLDPVRRTPTLGRSAAAVLGPAGDPLVGDGADSRGLLPRPAFDGDRWLRGRYPGYAGPRPHLRSSRRAPPRGLPASPCGSAVRTGHPCDVALPDQAAALRRSSYGRLPVALAPARHAAVVGSRVSQLPQRPAGATAAGAPVGPRQDESGFPAGAAFPRPFLPGEAGSLAARPRPGARRHRGADHRVHLPRPESPRLGRTPPPGDDLVRLAQRSGENADFVVPPTLGRRTCHRRTQDPSTATAGLAQSDPRGRGARKRGLAAGPLRGTQADVRSRDTARG